MSVVFGTETHTHTHTLARFLTHSHALSHSFAHSLTYTDTHTLSPVLLCVYAGIARWDLGIRQDGGHGVGLRGS